MTSIDTQSFYYNRLYSEADLNTKASLRRLYPLSGDELIALTDSDTGAPFFPRTLSEGYKIEIPFGYAADRNRYLLSRFMIHKEPRLLDTEISNLFFSINRLHHNPFTKPGTDYEPPSLRPILVVAFLGNGELMDLCLKVRPEQIHVREQTRKGTLLHAAVYGGNLSTLQKIIEKAPDMVLETDSEGLTPSRLIEEIVATEQSKLKDLQEAPSVDEPQRSQALWAQHLGIENLKARTRPMMQILKQAEQAVEICRLRVVANAAEWLPVPLIPELIGHLVFGAAPSEKRFKTD